MRIAADTTATAFAAGRRTLGIGLAATVLAAGAYAYTATNTVDQSFAGDGQGDISGYTVSDIQYTLAADPTTIDAVSFTLNSAAAVVKANTDTMGTDYAECTNPSLDGVSWECDFLTNPAVGTSTKLNVIATS